MAAGGYIKLFRGWMNSEVFGDDPLTDREAWLWLLENATWKAVVRHTKNGGVIELARGQIAISLASLASAWKWSIKRVRTYLLRLQKGHMVGLKKGTARGTASTVLTITNYNKYQGDDEDGGTVEGTVGAQLGHTQEEGKERKEEKKGGYAFAGSVIRLNDMDFARWKASFPLIDIRAILQSRDDWLRTQPVETQKQWFRSTSSWLAKQQQLAAVAMRETGNVKIGI